MTATEERRQGEGVSGRRSSICKDLRVGTRVRNKVWSDHRKERDMETNSAQGARSELAVSNRVLVPPDRVAFSCEGHCQLPCSIETSRRQEIQFCYLARQLPRPGLKETYGDPAL